MKNYELGLSYL